MGLVIRGKNMTVHDKSRDYIEKRVERFERHLKNITEIKVEVSAEQTQSQENHFKVEITIDCQGTFLRCEERAADLFSAVDAAAEIMNTQIDRYKGKLEKKQHPRSAGSKGEPSGVGAGKEKEPSDDEEGPRIRVKRFTVKPMSPEEAIDQMELLGHSFFVFFNDADEEINVVYRRKDDSYGVIEPVLD